MAEKNFEKNLQDLEAVVAELQNNSNSLDAALELYKKGLALTKKCYSQLKTVEKEVKLITEKDQEIMETTFDNE